MQIPALPKTVSSANIAPERLAHNSTLTEDQKITEASRQFEAILLRQILAATQKPIIQSKFTDNSTASQIYQDLVTNQLAETISKSGTFGLADTFEQQLTRSGAAKPPEAGAGSSRPAAFNSPHPGTGADLNLPGNKTQPPRAKPISHHPHE